MWSELEQIWHSTELCQESSKLSAKFGPNLTKVARIRQSNRTTSSDIGPQSTKRRPHSTIIGLTKFVPESTNMAWTGPNSVKLCPISTQFGRTHLEMLEFGPRSTDAEFGPLGEADRSHRSCPCPLKPSAEWHRAGRGGQLLALSLDGGSRVCQNALQVRKGLSPGSLAPNQASQSSDPDEHRCSRRFKMRRSGNSFRADPGHGQGPDSLGTAQSRSATCCTDSHPNPRCPSPNQAKCWPTTPPPPPFGLRGRFRGPLGDLVRVDLDQSGRLWPETDHTRPDVSQSWPKDGELCLAIGQIWAELGQIRQGLRLWSDWAEFDRASAF